MKSTKIVTTLCKCWCDVILKNTLGTLGVIIQNIVELSVVIGIENTRDRGIQWSPVKSVIIWWRTHVQVT